MKCWLTLTAMTPPLGFHDLQLLELLDFQPAEGIIRLRDQRMVIQGAAAMGLLRKALIEALGQDLARRLLLRFGYSDGYHDAVSFRDHFQWTDPVQGLLAGTTLHTLEGIVQSVPLKLDYDAATGAFDGSIAWRNSYEAEQHLHHYGLSTHPVCWTLTGYMSGYASACFGREVYFKEAECVGRGDPRCSLVGRHAEAWGRERYAPDFDFRATELQGEVKRSRDEVRRQTAALTRRERARGRQHADGVRESAARYAISQQFVARSAAMREILELATRVAPLDTTILITGESGTGKEFLARMIHAQSPRNHGPLVSVNCAALTETLLESELFGHVRGAFTGASRDKPGLFEQATNGTLFLDEIGDMTPALQAKVLRALQEYEIRRVGGDRVIKVNARVVAATNRDLRVGGAFREDLYFRLAGFVITIPPLRDRREDLPLLAYHVLRRAATRFKKPVRSISAEGMKILANYPWPGNVRELEHAIERAVILAHGASIGVRELPPEIRDPGAGSAASQRLNLKSQELKLIAEALARHGGNRRRAAQELGISTVSLWRKIKKRKPVAP
jgi:DNA-binding NtrC family response regulator